MSVLQKGKYQHYKGPLYEVLDVARHSETEEEMVVYRTLYGDFSLWVRPLKMFIQEIEYEGKKMKRFTYISDGEALK